MTGKYVSEPNPVVKIADNPIENIQKVVRSLEESKDVVTSKKVVGIAEGERCVRIQ